MKVLVAGAGVFGLTTAIELRERGHEVTIFDPGPLPHPLAESTDISKVVRMDYGADADYAELGERSLDGWRRWNAAWPEQLFYETGVTFLSREPMQPGGFEHDSYELLVARGHPLERLDAHGIAARFPAYAPGAMVDGYFNPRAGWAASGRVVARLVEIARAAGVRIDERAVVRIVDDGAVVREATRSPEATDDLVRGDLVIVCAGAWVPRLVPALAPSLRAIGQPVFQLRPAAPMKFEASRFPVFGADISRTGYYGFPINAEGIVKIANHGTGVAIASDAERVVHPGHEAALRIFLAETFPDLVSAPIVERRLCVYCDTIDEHFWIARDPDRTNVVVATGGSGHAFKFAPVLGALIADIALEAAWSHPSHARLAAKFRWRPGLADRTSGDAARHR